MTRGKAVPPVSVVMPVHNALPFLDEAVESILRQTWRDFEFVVYDDGSTDGSAERLEEWAGRDARIKLIRSARNVGPAASSNAVMQHASAPIIARMDADDISHPDRLRRQVEVLNGDPGVGLVGSLCNLIDGSGRKIRGPEYWRLSRSSPTVPFAHDSMMFRRQLFDRVGGYRRECEFWEDQELVLRMSAKSKVVVILEPLLQVRKTGSSTRLVSEQERVERALDLRYRVFARIARNMDYDDLLRSRDSMGSERMDPRIFMALGSLELIAGRRPKIVRRFLARARLRFDLATFVSSLWVAWASISPKTLCSVLNGISSARNLAARGAPRPEKTVQWSPPGQSRQHRRLSGNDRDKSALLVRDA